MQRAGPLPLLLAAFALGAPGAGSAVAADPPPPAAAPADRILSNERTLTRWAHADAAATIRSHPRPGARRVGRLRLYTEDGFDEVYLLLREHRDAAGRGWVKVRVPARSHRRVGWVRRWALGSYHVVRTRLEVNRRRLRMTLFRRGRAVWRAPVGIGKRGTPTPAGSFWIREIFRIPRDRLYGPYAFGTSAYSRLSDWPGGGVIGIHGPYGEPGRIPGRLSHGCIRLRRGDTAWLGRHLPLGTPLRIR